MSTFRLLQIIKRQRMTRVVVVEEIAKTEESEEKRHRRPPFTVSNSQRLGSQAVTAPDQMLKFLGLGYEIDAPLCRHQVDITFLLCRE